MMYIDHIEDDPSDPEMCIAYAGYGGPNQIATRMERAMILTVRPSTAFADLFDENLRVTKHETETPMRGHDEDGQCCRDAQFGIKRHAT